ncbi:hypothetical protein V6N12_038095 [Hibiscus sabdariffa]|uniref:Reverse transcriptase zinc-binding domain-containing protein n=1 Tax=Hibiscus sabdariffa TaxID=183260 RepID=A0ABR2BY64_9ROSI
MGVNGGASKEQEARGSWFTTLSFESPFGVDMDSGSQRFEEANEVCVASPVVPLDAMDHASALLKHVGNFAEQQRKRQIAQGKLVGTVSGAGKSLAGKDVPAGKEPRLVTAFSGSTVPRPLRVVDMVLINGGWDWESLAAILPKEKLDLIASIMHLQCGVGVDTPGGLVNWKRIWKLEVPQRIQVFIWLIFHERLLTNAERVHRHIASLDMCEVCESGREDIEHVLRSCSAAKGVWTQVVPRAAQETFFSLPFHDWLCSNLFSASFLPGDEAWGVRFAISCWLLWKRRCSFLFGSDEGVLEHVLILGNRMVGECYRTVAIKTGSRQGKDMGDWNLEVRHVARVSNGIADKLAKQGRELGMESTLFVAAPAVVAGLVEVEQRDSLSPTSAQGVTVDPGGSTL